MLFIVFLKKTRIYYQGFQTLCFRKSMEQVAQYYQKQMAVQMQTGRRLMVQKQKQRSQMLQIRLFQVNLWKADRRRL